MMKALPKPVWRSHPVFTSEWRGVSVAGTVSPLPRRSVECLFKEHTPVEEGQMARSAGAQRERGLSSCRSLRRLMLAWIWVNLHRTRRIKEDIFRNPDVQKKKRKEKKVSNFGFLCTFWGFWKTRVGGQAHGWASVWRTFSSRAEQQLVDLCIDASTESHNHHSYHKLVISRWCAVFLHKLEWCMLEADISYKFCSTSNSCWRQCLKGKNFLLAPILTG